MRGATLLLLLGALVGCRTAAVPVAPQSVIRPRCGSISLDTAGWQRARADVNGPSSGVTFKIPRGYRAVPDNSRGMHGPVSRFRASGRQISFYGGMYHFRVPNPSDGHPELHRTDCPGDRYTLLLASYRTKDGGYGVYAEWAPPAAPPRPGVMEAYVPLLYMYADSRSPAGQAEVLAVVKSIRFPWQQ